MALFEISGAFWETRLWKKGTCLIKSRRVSSLKRLLQGDGEEAENRRGDRADGGRAAPGGRGEEAAAVRLQVLRAAAPLHHRHPERPGLLHLLRYPVQPGRGHSGHGQQQHRAPERQSHHQRGVASARAPLTQNTRTGCREMCFLIGGRKFTS